VWACAWTFSPSRRNREFEVPVNGCLDVVGWRDFRETAGHPRPLVCSSLHLIPQPTQMAIPLQME
jgi:hypothetical protein